ncbi:lysophospholipid acyltransferase 7 [Venturia canescens]|uniref:lysophospholipid acyltransferase 7 n=1 Tax=Venturia canescens TaxID=32260 RepID=UPI001C9BE1A3|nr:lysophospholipid acyltransferase 7 [Venturia canescens]
MFIDDVIYVGLLLISVAFGSFFREIKNPATKQWVSTALGLTIAFIVSGRHVAHPLICTLVNALILTQCPMRKRHVASFFFSFFYLLVIFRLASWFGLPDAPAHTNLVQMLLTLRLVGLGFEIDAAKREPNEKSESCKALLKTDFLDVFHYGFSYMGLLTGPYYRYRTYWDCINRPFSKYANSWKATEDKLKLIGVLIVLHLVSGYLFPTNYVLTEEFRARSFLYRFWYTYPTFFTFRMRIFAGMALSECVCQMAGLGAYPTSCETVSGNGPRNYEAAEALAADEDNLKAQTMDFETIRNIDVFGVETCYQVRKAMKMWNTTVQYWMAVYVYKQFPSKLLRTPATLILSSLWHGYSIGYHICIVSVTGYLPFEDIYMKFYNQMKEDSMGQRAFCAFLFFIRLTWMSYLGLGFQILTFDDVYGFYRDLYWAGHVFVGVMWIVGCLLKPYLIRREKKTEEIVKERKVQ